MGTTIGARYASLENVINEVITELVRTTIEWLQAKQIILATKDLLKTETDQIHILKENVAACLTDATILARAEAKHAQTETQIWIEKAKEKAAQYKIEYLLGQKPDSLRHKFESALSQLKLPPIDSILSIPISSMRERPDIRVLRFELLAAQSNLAETEANLWPSISIGGFFGAQTGSGDLLLASNPLWCLTTTLTAPLFNFGKLHRAIDAANAIAKRASLEYENAVLLALQDTYTALSNYQNGLIALNHQKKALDYRKNALKLATIRFKPGLTTMMDLTTVQGELDQATILFITQKANVIMAYICFQNHLP